MEIVTKGEFARLRGVSQGRVSQWLSEGKIDATALVGEGRSARINVEVATAQLRARLDPTQLTGLNASGTDLSSRAPAPPPSLPLPVVTLPTSNGTLEQIQSEKLTQAKIATRKALDDEKARLGVYVLAADARGEMGRIAAQMLKSFEGALADFAAALSAKFELPNRDILHLLREEFRRNRERNSQEAAAEAEARPLLVGDEV